MLIHNFSLIRGNEKILTKRVWSGFFRFPLWEKKWWINIFSTIFFNFFGWRFFFDKISPPSQIVPRFRKTHLENRAVNSTGQAWQRLSECTLCNTFLEEPSCVNTPHPYPHAAQRGRNPWTGPGGYSSFRRVSGGWCWFWSGFRCRCAMLWHLFHYRILCWILCIFGGGGGDVA